MSSTGSSPPVVAQSVLFRSVECVLPYVAGANLVLPTTPGQVTGLATGPLSGQSCGDESIVYHADTSRAADTPDGTVLLANLDDDTRYVLGPADLTAADLAGAWAGPDGTAGYQVIVNFTAAGNAAFNAIAATRYAAYESDPSRPPPSADEAIDVNGSVVSVATLLADNFQGCVVTVGGDRHRLSATDAQNLVAEIQAAAHLAPLSAPPDCSTSGPHFIEASSHHLPLHPNHRAQA